MFSGYGWSGMCYTINSTGKIIFYSKKKKKRKEKGGLTCASSMNYNPARTHNQLHCTGPKLDTHTRYVCKS